MMRLVETSGMGGFYLFKRIASYRKMDSTL